MITVTCKPCSNTLEGIFFWRVWNMGGISTSAVRSYYSGPGPSREARRCTSCDTHDFVNVLCLEKL